MMMMMMMKKCNEVPLSQNMLGILPSPQYTPYPNQNLAHKTTMYFILPFFFKFVANTLHSLLS